MLAKTQTPFVLILVLMEYALLSNVDPTTMAFPTGLNPCSNGICSLIVTFIRG